MRQQLLNRVWLRLVRASSASTHRSSTFRRAPIHNAGIPGICNFLLLPRQ